MARRNFRRRVQEAEAPAVNLTPLIDVVFSILIMFIVVAPLLELDQVELADGNVHASDGGQEVHEKGPICLHVREDNTVWLNAQCVPLPQLAAALQREKQLHPEARPQLFHDKRAHFGTYQSVKNALETAGFEQMDVILKPS